VIENQQSLIKEKYLPKTKNGYNLDEVVSALQKSIRRCQEKEAVYWALEMVNSGFWRYLFKRLRTIAAEDIGLTNPFALIITNLLYLSFSQEAKDKGKKFFVETLQITELVMYMARAKKSRTVDYLCSIIDHQLKNGPKIEIPNEAIDMHTKAGKEKGMGGKEFYEEGSMIENKGYVAKDSEYKKECLEIEGFKNLKRNESKF